MNVVGIIAEYNPFHNGHLYQLECARKNTHADYTIVVMSGDFTQRGAPALLNKYDRAQMALFNGADLVLELPVCFATGSAEYFAKGAVSLLSSLGVVTHLAFGSECGDIEALKDIAAVLAQPSTELLENIGELMKKGCTYPQARIRSIESLYPEVSHRTDLLSSPNNTLGIEYIKSILQDDSAITPVTVKRFGSDYHEKRLSNDFSSALSIRQTLVDTCDPDKVRCQLPDAAYQVLNDRFSHSCPVLIDDFSQMLYYKLIEERFRGYAQYYDVTGDLSDRIVNNLEAYTDATTFSFYLKTKEMTYTRICRSLLHILLGITKQDIAYIKEQSGYASYARVLGIRESAAPLLKEITDNATIPLLLRNTDLNTFKLNTDSGQKRLLELDLNASYLYEAVSAHKFSRPFEPELKKRILKV